MNDDLKRLFRQSSSVNFISGKRDSGKTDFGLLLLQTGKEAGIFDKIGANVTTRDDPNIEYICFFDRLEDWLKTPGRKAFLLDEMGKHLYRMSFMSRMTKMILGICQLVRKFDAHLIGIAPNADLVNKMFFNTDLLDCLMEKLSKKTCLVNNMATHSRPYRIEHIPRTSIRFLTKDIALFGEKDPNRGKEKLNAMPIEEKALILYAKHHNMRDTAKVMNVSAMTVSNLLKKALAKRDLLK